MADENNEFADGPDDLESMIIEEDADDVEETTESEADEGEAAEVETSDEDEQSSQDGDEVAETAEEPEAATEEEDPLAFMADLPADEAAPAEAQAATAPSQEATLALAQMSEQNQMLAQQVAQLHAQMAEMDGAPEPDLTLINPDDPTYNPEEYNRQMLKYQQHRANKAVSEQKVAETKAQEDARLYHQRAEFIQQRDAQLAREMPFLFQGEKGEQAAKAIVGAAVKSGIPAEDAQYLTAPMVKVFFNSLRWEAASAAKAKVQTKSESPRPVKPVAKGKVDRGKDALQRFSKTGSDDAAIDYLTS